MNTLLGPGGLFEGLGGEGGRRLAAMARRQALAKDEYLFVLGDSAAELFVVERGKVDLCLPMRLHGTVKDVSVESVGAGQPLGWSALVKPYRFTLSARAAEPSEIVCLGRRDLFELFELDPRIGYAFFTKISEVVGIRLLTFQALWMRELQRAVENETQRDTRGAQTGAGLS